MKFCFTSWLTIVLYIKNAIEIDILKFLTFNVSIHDRSLFPYFSKFNNLLYIVTHVSHIILLILSETYIINIVSITIIIQAAFIPSLYLNRHRVVFHFIKINYRNYEKCIYDCRDK